MVHNGQDERLAAHLEAQLIRIALGRPVRSIQLLYQSLLRKPLKGMVIDSAIGSSGGLD